jgi:hypothetical protein
MKYTVGQKFMLCGIECSVALVNSKGWAYLAPETEGEEYNNGKTLIGVVFAIANEDGVDRLGNTIVCLNNVVCGAV